MKLFLAIANFLFLIFIDSKAFAQPGTATYIPPSCQGMPIAKMSVTEMLAQKVLDLKPNPSITQEDQLKLFNTVTKILDENYLYPDYRGLNWPLIVDSFRNVIEAGLATEKFYSLMEQLILRLGDNHSHFESPAKAAAVSAQLAGQTKYVGIGAYLLPMLTSKYVTVLSVIPGSPAEHAGIKQHDIILEVDGLPLIEGDKVYPHTRGPECTTADLTVQSPGKKPRHIHIIRAPVPAGIPIDARLIPTTDGSRIGYIFLPTFLDLSVLDKVKKALEGFGKLDGLVLDNRMNGGGSSNVLIPMLGIFTSGKMGDFVSRASQRPLEITAHPIHNSQTVPIVILISKNTVSYAEVFSGVLKDIGRAKLVGETSAGRVETLSGYNFPDGSKAWLARERFVPIKTKINWQGAGVKPDTEAITKWDEFTFETDPALVVALKLLLQQ